MGGKGEWGCIGMSCLTALLCIRCSSELSAFLSSTHTPSHLFTSTFTFGSLVNFPLGERERERERESFYLSTSKQPLDWLFLLVKIFLPYWNCKPLFRIILILFLFYVIFRDKISLPRYATWTYLMCCNHVFVFCHFL